MFEMENQTSVCDTDATPRTATSVVHLITRHLKLRQRSVLKRMDKLCVLVDDAPTCLPSEKRQIGVERLVERLGMDIGDIVEIIKPW